MKRSNSVGDKLNTLSKDNFLNFSPKSVGEKISGFTGKASSMCLFRIFILYIELSRLRERSHIRKLIRVALIDERQKFLITILVLIQRNPNNRLKDKLEEKRRELQKKRVELENLAAIQTKVK